MVRFLGQKIPCTIAWPYTEGTWLYCDNFIWCVSCTVVVITCFVRACARTFVCACVGNMCTCIYCVLHRLYCIFVLFCLHTFILIYFVCTRSKERTKITFCGNVMGCLHLHGNVLVHHSAYSPSSETLKSETCHWIYCLWIRNNMALSETWNVIQFPSIITNVQHYYGTPPVFHAVMISMSRQEHKDVVLIYNTPLSRMCHTACSNEWAQGFNFVEPSRPVQAYTGTAFVSYRSRF